MLNLLRYTLTWMEADRMTQSSFFLQTSPIWLIGLTQKRKNFFCFFFQVKNWRGDLIIQIFKVKNLNPRHSRSIPMSPRWAVSINIRKPNRMGIIYRFFGGGGDDELTQNSVGNPKGEKKKSSAREKMSVNIYGDLLLSPSICHTHKKLNSLQ